MPGNFAFSSMVALALLGFLAQPLHHSVAVPRTIRDLHHNYHAIFASGNRNAASHLWVSHVLEAAPQLTAAEVKTLFSGFCAVSGSIVRPSDYNRYRLTLPAANPNAGRVSAYMHYCCWPCVCDVQDFVLADTATVETADGSVSMWFATLGDPCARPEELRRPFTQPFDGRTTTLERDAPELRCADGKLVGARYSDHGHVMIALLFGVEPFAGAPEAAAAALAPTPQPGRISRGASANSYQDEVEYAEHCAAREAAGHNSGMGEIFRKVAAISRVVENRAALPPRARAYEEPVAVPQQSRKKARGGDRDEL